VTCRDWEFCDYPSGCGFADGTGVCRPRPMGCAGVVEPVCGCDGATYSNACVAHAAGVDAYYEGACTTGP